MISTQSDLLIFSFPFLPNMTFERDSVSHSASDARPERVESAAAQRLSASEGAPSSSAVGNARVRAVDTAQDTIDKQFGTPAFTEPATALNGKVCKQQPGEGQVPVLQPGDKQGCKFSDDPSDKAAYDEGVRHAAKLHDFDGKGRETSTGSAVIVGQEGADCKVLTDHHVIYSDKNPHPAVGITMPNGKNYAFWPGAGDKKGDLYVGNVDTKGDPGACLPAKFPDPGKKVPDNGDAIHGVGFPLGANSPYLRKGQITGTSQLKQDYKPVKGEDPERWLINTNATSRPGNSGEGVYNKDNELVGVHKGGDGRNYSDYLPLSKEKVDELIKQSHR